MSPISITILICAGGALCYYLDQRYIKPRRQQRLWEEILTKKSDPRSLEKADNGVISSDGDYLKVTNKMNEEYSIRWIDIEEVYAFKRDLLIVDLICLEFKVTGNDEFLEINEEMLGYHEMMQHISNRLSGFSAEWFSDVAFPAFATNHRVVWRREGIRG